MQFLLFKRRNLIKERGKDFLLIFLFLVHWKWAGCWFDIILTGALACEIFWVVVTRLSFGLVGKCFVSRTLQIERKYGGCQIFLLKFKMETKPQSTFYNLTASQTTDVVVLFCIYSIWHWWMELVFFQT